MDEILKNVLKEIKPVKKEEKEFSDKVRSVINRINKNLKDAKAILGGSGVKGTWLKDVHDADIFVQFDYEIYKGRSAEISGILEKCLKKEFKGIIKIHGSRDYFQIKKKGFTFEIIPILKIKKAEQAKNLTDVSPLHAKWVKKHSKFRDDILLTKQFCKSTGTYGAESYIKGFSGYVCEILTVHYKGFSNLIKNAAKWKDKTAIDAENHYKNKDISYILNKSKLISPLIVIDPVQKDRNAAAALSSEKFEVFINECRNFLRKPSERFFEKKEFSVSDLKKCTKGKNLVLLEITAKQGKKDIVGCKLVKAFDFLNKKLAKNDFKVLKHGWEWDEGAKALFYFVLKKETLPKDKLWEGPPINAKEHVTNFKKKYKKTFVKLLSPKDSKGLGNSKNFQNNKRIYATIKRKFTTPEGLIRFLAKDSYIKDKVKGIRIKNE